MLAHARDHTEESAELKRWYNAGIAKGERDFKDPSVSFAAELDRPAMLTHLVTDHQGHRGPLMFGRRSSRPAHIADRTSLTAPSTYYNTSTGSPAAASCDANLG